MALPISGIYNGTQEKVISASMDGQLSVISESLELQHYVSRVKENTYQVISVDTGITAATETQMHIKNDDPDKLCVISFIRVQAITNTASKPVVGEYWQLGFGRTVSSGGTAATPVNTFVGSGNTASVTCTGINPTMAGTFTEIDRWYNESNNIQVWNKQGSIILGLNDTFEARLVSGGTGEAMCRVTFMMIDK